MCLCLYVCVFIKLYITVQSGPATLVFSMPLALILPRGDVFSSHLFGTSSSLNIPAGVTQEEGHTGFLIHLPSEVHTFIFLARRVQPFLSLADREVNICVCVRVFSSQFIRDIKFVGHISRGHTGARSYMISHSPSFCGACLNFYR